MLYCVGGGAVGPGGLRLEKSAFYLSSRSDIGYDLFYRIDLRTILIV